MDLSIIIVNYNVKYFLEQCLCSVKKAIEKIEAEVFVVDNNSTDGSFDYLKPKFSFVQFIINKENMGFAKANNKALAITKGRYILFLNPDTIVAEDTFEKCIFFSDLNQGTGALGVKMIDGKGIYLKESMRGFPSPWVSFCKLSGLTAIFPHSKFFSKYYLGHLNENENQVIDSISGAFFFTRKNVLEKTGGFDEQFFMYAEDIDLSYRIRNAGYENRYLAETTIIHFKGESTKKDARYVKQFYKSMSQFANKYFTKRSPLIFLLIQPAIKVRSFLAFLIRFFSTSKKAKPVNSKTIYLSGTCGTELLPFLSVSGKSVVNNRASAEEIIFCQGQENTFKRIIETIQVLPKTQRFLFHAFGSCSIVASPENRKPGTSFELNS